MRPADLGGRSAYEVLGVPFDAEDSDLKSAWRRAARRTHPDYGGDAAEFRVVSYAWELVGTEDARRAYDETLGGIGGAAHGSPSPHGTTTAPGAGSRGARPASGTGDRTGAGDAAARARRARARQRTATQAGADAGGTVEYVPSLDDVTVLDLARSSQQVHGAPRKRGILPAGHRLVREARTIRALQTHVLSVLPAARLVNGLQVRFGRLNSGPVDHVVLCGDRIAVIGSVQLPDGVYRWDGAELVTGGRPVAPPSLAPAMVALQRAFPDCTVGGFVLVHGTESNPHSPVIQLDRTRSITVSDAGFLTDPPANALQFGRDLKMFLGTGGRSHTVYRRLLARLLGAMY